MSRNQRTGTDLILGTAGHIDHGKSTLVQALTGTDPDRLSEEKQRGITIKLGFAQLDLPDGSSMGVVDVPGHERFVREMIAGATGIDVALLVIAADDGIMPQTIEHIAVLQTLGISHVVVALTKSDLVDSEWLAFAQEDVAAYLAETPYADSEIICVSGRTGAGLDELKAAIQRAAQRIERHDIRTTCRLPVDRSFTIKGAGTIATGTLWSGTIEPGQVLQILPKGKTARVRSVQVHHEDAQTARPGNRVAVNLAEASTDDVPAGSFVCTPGSLQVSDRFTCHLTYLDTAKTGKPLVSGVRMHIAHGTCEVIGRVLLCANRASLAPGESAYAHIRLDTPLPISCKDRFVVRTYSPVHVAGGGEVLLAHPRRSTTLSEADEAMLDCLRSGDMEGAVAKMLEDRKTPTDVSSIARVIGLERDFTQRILAHLTETARVVSTGSGDAALYASPAAYARTQNTIEQKLLTFHADNPTEAGLPKEALRRQTFPNISQAAFDGLLSRMSEKGLIVAKKGAIGHPSAQQSAQQALEDAADALAALLEQEGMTPDELSLLAKRANIAPTMAGRAAAALAESGRAYRANASLIFDAHTIENAKKAVAAFLEENGTGTAAELRDCMGTTRKYALPLLEAFDSERFTVREGDVRRLA